MMREERAAVIRTVNGQFSRTWFTVVKVVTLVLGLAVSTAACGDLQEIAGPSGLAGGQSSHTLPGGAQVRSFDTATCNTATATFVSGTEVCAKGTGLGNGFVGTLQWIDPSNTVVRTTAVAVNGSIQDRFTPLACGTWTLRLIHPNGSGTDILTGTFEVTDCAQGCSPGYWRQDQHFGSWPNPPAPTDTFQSIFARLITVDLGPSTSVSDPTLLEALEAIQGGVNRIARIGTAAYLSAVHAGVAYPYTAAQVVTAVQNALDGVAGPISIDDLENVWKNVVDHCPLGAESGN